jgi:hypothetical protein
MRNVFLAMKKIAAIGACAFLFLGSFSVPQVAFGAPTAESADGTVSASSAKAADDNFAKNVVTSVTSAQLPVQVIGTLIAQLIDWVTAGVGWLFLKLLEVLLIPILGYNGFSSSPIISLGWPLVRDVVNMFVVLVLLIIGIGTIVGWKNAHWDQQLPQLFIAIVAVNFSRTLCGLAIDLSQIIMFTFVNSIAQIAAGNFEQLLGFSALSTFAQSFSSSSSSVGVSLTVGALLANAYLRLALHIAVFAVILLLTLAFIWRIVTLWVLVIISPLAFFMQGIQGIYKGASGIWGDWVSRFTAALTLGPMLAFFLWLSLAASSSGSIAQTEAFPEPDPSADSSVGLVLQAFEGSTLASLLLGLVLLIVGMQQAAASASKLGGFAASLINEKMGRRVAKFGLRASDRIGTGLPRSMVIGAGTLMGSKGLVDLGRVMPSSLESLSRKGYQASSKKAGSGVIALGQAMGSTSIVSAGGWLQGLEHGDKEKLEKDAKAWLSHASDREKLARLLQAINGEGSNTVEAQTENFEILKWAQTSGGRKFVEKNVEETERDKIFKGVLNEVDHHKDHLDDNEKKADLAFRTRFAHFLGQDAQVKLAEDKDFDPSNLTDKSAEALANNSAAVDVLRNNIVGTEGDGKGGTRLVSMYDNIVRGQKGKDAKKGFAGHAYADALSAGNYNAVVSNQANLNRVSWSSLTAGAPQTTGIVAAFINTNAKLDSITDAAKRGAAEAVIKQSIVNNQSLDVIAKALNNGLVTVGDLAGNLNRKENLLAIAGSGEDLSGATTLLRDLATIAKTNPQRLGMSFDEMNALRKKLLDSGARLEDVIDGLNIGSGSLTNAQWDQLKQLLSSNAALAGQLGVGINPQGPNDISNLLQDMVNDGVIAKMAEKARTASGADRLALRDAIQNAYGPVLNHILNALVSEQNTRGQAATNAEAAVRNAERELNNASQAIRNAISAGDVKAEKLAQRDAEEKRSLLAAAQQALKKAENVADEVANEVKQMQNKVDALRRVESRVK